MDNKKFENLCIKTVVNYFNSHVEKTDNKKITESDVYVVWMCKTLQNNKALVSTTISDGLYYEITHNGDKNETYVDVYKKWENFVTKNNELCGENETSCEKTINKKDSDDVSKEHLTDQTPPHSITITEPEFRELCLSKISEMIKTDDMPPAIGMLATIVLSHVACELFREKEDK